MVQEITAELPGPPQRLSTGPAVIRGSGIADPGGRPAPHRATFRAGQIDAVIDSVDTPRFGLHNRIDDRVQRVVEPIHAGNACVSRNQIGRGRRPAPSPPWYWPNASHASTPLPWAAMPNCRPPRPEDNA